MLHHTTFQNRDCTPCIFPANKMLIYKTWNFRRIWQELMVGLRLEKCGTRINHSTAVDWDWQKCGTRINHSTVGLWQTKWDIFNIWTGCYELNARNIHPNKKKWEREKKALKTIFWRNSTPLTKEISGWEAKYFNLYILLERIMEVFPALYLITIVLLIISLCTIWLFAGPCSNTKHQLLFENITSDQP